MNLAVQRSMGGQRLQYLSLALGGGGLALTALGLQGDLRATLFSYLFGFIYWLSLALGAMLLLGTFHAAGARWPVVFRRSLELMSLTTIPLALLFIPIALGMKQIFVWVAPPTALGPQMLEKLALKSDYLNPSAFLIRAAIYFAIWATVSELLFRWSTRQDERGGLKDAIWQRRLGTASMPFLAVTLSFASCDWVMSLDPLWTSTVFALYFFAGGFLGAIALATGVMALSGWKGYPPGVLASPSHFASLGKLLLAFVAFWAYLAYTQYMLVWIANLPHELTWYSVRTTTGWSGVGIAVAVLNFALPFVVLLSKKLKIYPRALGGVAIGILCAHALDVYWMVLPALHPDRPWWRWTDLTALLGIGGVCVAFAVFRQRGHYAVPVRDPHLSNSLRYHPT